MVRGSLYHRGMEPDATLAATSAVATSTGRDDGELRRGAILGRFLVVDRLGAGAMGVVYSAHDPELDRRVALKVLQPSAGLDDTGRVRLLREAQALAKLAHPNVVAIHDVGVRDERVWIAMEFVRGQTLAAWACERRRRWPEVVRVLTDVARGIAAAHAAGLIHRDLKPENVMIDRDGRVRVMDFGLAHGRSAAGSGARARPAKPGASDLDEVAMAATVASGAGDMASALGQRLTRSGGVLGTPAYMAPEQWDGVDVDAPADQFSWCVMAWELLYGERPFAGETMATLAAAVQKGERRPPPRGASVPRWLRAIVERGLAVDPAARWPTMAALVTVLEHGRTNARRRGLLLALAGLAALLGVVEGARRWDVARRVSACEATAAEIDAAWNDEVRGHVQGAVSATGIRDAAETGTRVGERLDQHQRAWQQSRVDACLNARVSSRWDEDMYDRALWCLEERRLAIESLVVELGAADKPGIHKAVAAAANLRPARDCLDAERLRRLPAPPTDRRDALLAVRRAMSRVSSLALLGKYADGLKMATENHERAVQEVAWRPLITAALQQEGLLLGQTGALAEAERVSAEAYYEAARIDAWDVAADAASSLIHTVGVKQGRHAEGRAWARHAAIAVAHVEDTAGTAEASRLIHLAAVERLAGDLAAAQASAERALSLYEAALGREHLRVATALSNLANIRHDLGALDEARALQERALAILVEILGAGHPDVAVALSNLSWAYYAAGDFAKVRELTERATAIFEATLGPDHPLLSASLVNLAGAYKRTGSLAQAQALYERAHAIAEPVHGADHPTTLEILEKLADLHRTLDHPAEARAIHARVLAAREAKLGADHPDVAASLQRLGRLALDTRDPAAALGHLERAVAIFAAHEGAQDLEYEAQAGLAEAILATGGDKGRARALADEARRGFRQQGAAAEPALRELEAWMARNIGAPAP